MDLKKEKREEKPAGNHKVSVARSRKFKYGALATVITILFIVAVIVVNMIAGLLGERYPLSLDLTQDQVFQMSQQSIDFVQGIDKDVTITVLATESEFSSYNAYYLQANTVIKQYAQYSDHITVDYVDTAKNPGILNKYDASEEELYAGCILVECGNRHVVVDPADLFNIETQFNQSTFQQESYITSSKAEQTMTSAIWNVTSDDQVQISLLTGYGEQDSSAFVDLLKKNNYNVIEQNLITDEQIDPNSDFAIIFAPERDYDESSIQKLTTFVSNNEQYGKTVLLVASQNQEQLTNINTFLAQWNIGMSGGWVCEMNMNYLFQASYLSNFCDYGETEYTEGLPNPETPVAMPFSKEIEVQNADMVKVLLQTSSDAVVRPADAEDSWTPESATAEGPVPTAVMSTKTKFEGTTELSGNVIVVGSVYAMNEDFLSDTSFNNSVYFLNLFNQIADREDAITIDSKAVDTRELGINQAQVNVNGIIFMVVLPILVLVVGLVIWIRRRNR